jgi:hypothetical protein
MSEISLGSILYRTTNWAYNNLVSKSYAQEDLRSIGYTKYDDEGDHDNSVTLDEVLNYCEKHNLPKGDKRLRLLGDFFRITGPDTILSPYDAHIEAGRISNEFESIFTLRGTKYEVFAFCNKPSLITALMSLKLYRVGHAIVVGDTMFYNRDQSITRGTETYYLPSRQAVDMLNQMVKSLISKIDNFNIYPLTNDKNANLSLLNPAEKIIFKRKLVVFLDRYLNP